MIAICLFTLVAVSNAFCPSANTPERQNFVSNAKTVLDDNWVPTMNSTLPSPNLYPHQWSWDAAFVAIGYSHFDTRRAIDETNALFRGQWNNGLIPHIVFNPAAVESYFPGPAFWKIESAGDRGPPNAQTSGIIQPPVHAIASLAIYANAAPGNKHVALDHLRDIYPKIKAWHDYLYRERDLHDRGLVFIRHMWESGMDNSPAWDHIIESTDGLLKREPHRIPPYTRVDKGKVSDTQERPDGKFYDHAVHLIKIFYDNEYDEKRIAEESPFVVEGVLFNSILARANAALGKISDILDMPDEARVHRERSERTAAAITKHLYRPEWGFFYNYDVRNKRHIMTRISGGMVGIFGAKICKEQLEAIVRHLYSDGFLRADLSAWTLPSVATDDPAYTNTTYWRGPAWINMNYLVRDGLVRNARGNKDALRIADYLRDRSVELVTKSGFYEYFSPICGTPHGGHMFSWSAALGIDMVCRPELVNDMQLQNRVSMLLHALATSVPSGMEMVAAIVVVVVVLLVSGAGYRAQLNSRDSVVETFVGGDSDLRPSFHTSAAQSDMDTALRRRSRTPS